MWVRLRREGSGRKSVRDRLGFAVMNPRRTVKGRRFLVNGF